MTTLIAFLSSKLGRYLALISAILTGVALYGYRKKESGRKEVVNEITESTRKIDHEIEAINRQPLSDNIGTWVRKAKTDHHI